MATQRSSFIQAMVRDSFPYFIEKYDAIDPVFSQVYEVESTSGAYEQFTTAIGPGALTVVAEGQSIPRVSAQEGFTVICAVKKRAEEFPITNEAISDNRKIANMLKAWAGGYGESVRNAQEQDHADVFNYGAYTSGHTTFDNSIPAVITPSYGNYLYDGKPLFAASGNNHTAKNGSTYYNAYSSKQLGSAGLQDVMKLLQITNAKNEAGLEVTLIPNTILVQAGSANYYIAKKLLESTGDSQEAHEGIINVWRGSLRLIPWRFLTKDADAWFVGIAKKGLKSLSRMAPKIDYYEHKNTDSQIVRIRVRWGKAPTNFRYWVGCNQSTS